MPENWMRGQFNMTCAKGTVGVFFTLAPTQPPAVQHLAFQKLASTAYGWARRPARPPGCPARRSHHASLSCRRLRRIVNAATEVDRAHDSVCYPCKP